MAEPVSPTITDFSYGLGEVKLQDGTKLVAFRLDLVTGTVHLFMPADTMIQMGHSLINQAQKLKASSISLASPEDLKSILNGNSHGI